MEVTVRLLRRVVDAIGRSVKGFLDHSSNTPSNYSWRSGRHGTVGEPEDFEGWGRRDRVEESRAAERGEVPRE